MYARLGRKCALQMVSRWAFVPAWIERKSFDRKIRFSFETKTSNNNKSILRTPFAFMLAVKNTADK